VGCFLSDGDKQVTNFPLFDLPRKESLESQTSQFNSIKALGAAASGVCVYATKKETKKRNKSPWCRAVEIGELIIHIPFAKEPQPSRRYHNKAQRRERERRARADIYAVRNN
jgi:hypothetical protein